MAGQIFKLVGKGNQIAPAHVTTVRWGEAGIRNLSRMGEMRRAHFQVRVSTNTDILLARRNRMKRHVTQDTNIRRGLVQVPTTNILLRRLAPTLAAAFRRGSNPRPQLLSASV